MSDQNTIERAMGGLGSTIVRAGERLKQARKDFGHAHEPKYKLISTLLASMAAIAVVTLLMVRWDDASAIDYVELPSRDLRVNALEDNATRDPDILLINIDEAALAYGDWPGEVIEGAADPRFAWPWPRQVYNKIIRYCREGGARVIVFDFVFSETGPNTNQPWTFRDIDGQTRRVFTFDQAGDDLFAMEVGARDDVAMALVLGGTEREGDEREPLLQQFATQVEGSARDGLMSEIGGRYARFRSADAPYPALLHGWPSMIGVPEDEDRGLQMWQQIRGKIENEPYLMNSPRYRSLFPFTETERPDGVAGLGLVMGFHDADGALRRYDIAGTHAGETYRSLSLETWRLYVLSYAREAQLDAGQRDSFSERFPGLRVDEHGLHTGEDTYHVENELRDVPLQVQRDKAYYLGREMPLDEAGRVELRFHNMLPYEENASWAQLSEEQKQAVRERNPDGTMFAVYPQVSARDILQDWDAIGAARYKSRETARLTGLIAELEEALKDAEGEDAEYIEWDLGDARTELERVKRIPTPEPVYGDPSNLMHDKIVFIAGTAAGLKDIHATPLSDATPGTWVLATAFDNLKNNDFMSSPPRWIEWLSAIVATLLAVFGVMYAGRLRNGLVLVLGLGLVTVLASWMAFEQQVWVATAAPLAGLLFGFSHGALAKALSEGRQRRHREAFARQYMGKELVDFVINNPNSLKLGGENKEMSIYFSDVAGFTTVTEVLGANNPERLVELLNVYLERMTDLMLETGGVIDKYIGDAIMCFWGAPMSMEDHAVRACNGALRCRAELRRMQPLFADAVREVAPQLIKPDGTVLHARAGINSGIVTVGNMGSSKRFAYTVMGDAVNLAARLEPQNKEYGTDLMLGEKTEAMIRGEFTTRPLDLMVVKGKTEPVEVFELLGEKEVPQFVTDMLGHWNRGIELFRDRQFEPALEAFRNAAHHEAIQDEGELNPSRLYIQRCEDLIATPPPPEWNGVYVKKTK